MGIVLKAVLEYFISNNISFNDTIIEELYRLLECQGVAHSLGQMDKRLEFQDIRSRISHNHKYSLVCPNNYPLLSRAASRSPKPSALGVPYVQSRISTARLLRLRRTTPRKGPN
jgi:hypothetical protein